MEGRQQFRYREIDVMETLFPLGQLLATPGALSALEEAKSNLVIWILRHAAVEHTLG